MGFGLKKDPQSNSSTESPLSENGEGEGQARLNPHSRTSVNWMFVVCLGNRLQSAKRRSFKQ